MKYIITETPTSVDATALAVALGGRVCDRYEIEDTVFRAPPFAWDLSLPQFAAHRPAFDALVAQCQQIEADRAAEETARLANPPPPEPYRVSRDTLWTRVKEAIGTEQACAIVASWSEPQRIDWFGNSWFWSNNEAIRAMLVALGLDPVVILAPDLYL